MAAAVSNAPLKLHFQQFISDLKPWKTIATGILIWLEVLFIIEWVYAMGAEQFKIFRLLSTFFAFPPKIFDQYC